MVKNNKNILKLNVYGNVLFIPVMETYFFTITIHNSEEVAIIIPSKFHVCTRNGIIYHSRLMSPSLVIIAISCIHICHTSISTKIVPKSPGRRIFCLEIVCERRLRTFSLP